MFMQLIVPLFLLAGAPLFVQATSPQSAASRAAASNSAATRSAAGDLPPPEGLKDNPSIWPNRASHRNSDDWLWRNHDQLRQMQPRVLILNFADDMDEAAIRGHAEPLVKAFAEATRYHGYADKAAAPFIEYRIVKVVDLRDEDAREKPRRTTSARFPKKKDHREGEPLIDYAALFGDEFAPQLGFADPRKPGRFLNLRELVDAGWVHELWFYAIHDPGHDWPGCETCEMKQFYDEQCRPIRGRHGSAGNGEDRSMPWLGRSFRIAFFNPHRGPGCSMENFGHTMEWIASSNSNAYYRRYFFEFADFELKQRGLPFDSFYETSYDRASGDKMEYPKPDRIEIHWNGGQYAVEPFFVTGGSAHFPPGARWHYDLESPFTALTTLETYRTRKSPADRDEQRPFSRERFQRYREVAPDCMGQWIVYWFQSMPGLDNPCIDADGRPMKNWWPFLFY